MRSGEIHDPSAPVIRFRDHDAAEPPRAEDEGEGAWQPDDVLLTTVGIDIGSTTAHLMFARLRLQRLSSFSSRFVPVERVVLHRSPIRFTPYRPDGAIDAEALGAFIDEQYAAAGLSRDAVDTGAVILTGTALERRNAGQLAEIFAAHGGQFVCATAGHRLEAILAAHGSGAVARSRRESSVVLNLDVGGGTTKLALVDRGEIVATSAIAAGARLVAFGPDGAPRRVEPQAALFAERAGLRIDARFPPRSRLALASSMAEAIEDAAHGRALTGELAAAQLLPPVPSEPRPRVVTLSGGVAEIVFGEAPSGLDDLGAELAASLRERALPAPLERPDEGIRATVVGASQYAVHLSGSTIFVSDERLLPLRNVPVVAARTGESADAAEIERAVRSAVERSGHAGDLAAVALTVGGEPAYARLRAIADGLLRAIGGRRPLVAAISGDVGLSVGRILANELNVEGGLLVIDDVELADLDFIDVGAVLRPAGVVPVVVKTLVLGAR